MAKAKRSRSKSIRSIGPALTQPRTINIKTAKNGYIVNVYDNKKDVTYIAQKKSDVKKIVNREGKL
jgi:hypothetical protein